MPRHYAYAAFDAIRHTLIMPPMPIIDARYARHAAPLAAISPILIHAYACCHFERRFDTPLR